MSIAVILLLEFTAFVICLCLSAFFSSSEMALFSLSRAKVLSYRNDPSIVRRRIYYLMDDYHKTLITIILGNMFVNSCISMLNDEMLSKMSLDPTTTMILSGVTAIIILLLFGEITPMTIAYVHCDFWSKKVATPVYYFRKFLNPITSTVGHVCDKILDLLGRKTVRALSAKEYLSYLDTGVEQGAFTHDEAELLKETFMLREKNVDEIMRSRVDLAHVNYNISGAELADAIQTSRQAYMPVAWEDMDTADSLVSSVEFFDLPPDKRDDWLKNGIVQKAVFLPESCTLTKALHTFHDKKIKAALVADEYGGVAGMLTIQDIYSELAGKSVELHDQEEWQFVQLNKDTWIFDGTASLDFVRRNSGWTACNLNNHFESNSLSGIFCEAFGALPEINETIHIGNVELKALAITKNRVTKVLIHLEDSSENGTEGGAAS